MTLVTTLAACALPTGQHEQEVEGNSQPWLVDQAAERGVDFVLVSGASGLWALPEIISGGVALFDADNDGDLDIYLVQSGAIDDETKRPPNRLFLNDGTGHFRDATAASGTDHRGWGMGVATGDFDNDGLVDLYVCNAGPNVLYHNLGGGRFEDVTNAAGLVAPEVSSSAAFFDYDLDGDLDIISLSYLSWSLESEQPCFDELGRRDYCSPLVYEASKANRLFRNRGDGTFEDVSEAAGIQGEPGTSLGVVTGDFTGDGRPDFFVSNDGMEDRLWVAQEGGRFINQGMERGCAVDDSGRAKAGMGVAASDLDDDGDLDLIIANMGRQTDSLFLNEGERFFIDATAHMGIAATSRRVTRFGLGLVDFDNDGRLDLFQTTGRMNGADAEGSFSEPNLLYRHLPSGRFEHLTDGIGGTARHRTGRGLAFGDLDGDGWIDAVVVNRDEPVELLMNQQPGDGESLLIKVLDSHGRPALGAVVRAEVSGRIIRREVSTAWSYLSANDDRVHLAYPAGRRPPTVEVEWLGGAVQSFATGTDAVLTVRQD